MPHARWWVALLCLLWACSLPKLPKLEGDAGVDAEVPVVPACRNTMDDDNDGLVDDLDVGCADPEDANEHGDDVCDNGLDEDGDTLLDFQVGGAGDPGCSAPADT